ncbi:helix-turn-helix domain-containing protein [Enterococcus rivorum]|uniref:HTH cro/C1-type domain-containing protein n=2 Tax=Enterococcus rivorum TaxID=762845 RepID=A0A1E5KWH0_9ENTE|nr:tetratricopeptide repeat protein [Enterococcus rivorum]MBP2099032.1 tetratricopeptide (TPR) repeat protein [Enterococcus rivorum]OEH82213.1 hypothetical protein BCR26_13985 [Enterococcus rivorum]
MKVLGEKIQQARKMHRLSQSALAAGICTQATISKIENKNRCESLDVFSSICSKLELSVFECLEESYEQETERILTVVEKLREQLRAYEAHEILEEYNFKEDKLSYFTKTKFLYYKGSTSLLGKSDFEGAIAYLKQVVRMKNKTNIYHILSMNAIGVSYELQGKYREAAKYNEKAYQMLNDFPDDELPVVASRLFYNLAKYYSSLKDYERSIELCEEGIKLCKRKNTIMGVDVLLYEKAYNEYHLNGAIEGYKLAYYFTDFMNHKVLMETIKKNMKEYNIQL